MNKSCCFVGSESANLLFRNQNNERYIEVKNVLYNKIINLITNEGVTDFITDMSAGINIFAGQVVTELKKRCMHIKLECVIPFEE